MSTNLNTTTNFAPKQTGLGAESTFPRSCNLCKTKHSSFNCPKSVEDPWIPSTKSPEKVKQANSHISNGEGMIGGSSRDKWSSARAADCNNNSISNGNRLRLPPLTAPNGMRLAPWPNGRNGMRPIHGPNGMNGRMNQPKHLVHRGLPPPPPLPYMPMPPMPSRPNRGSQRQNERGGRRVCMNPGAQGGFGLVTSGDSKRRPTSEGKMKDVLACVRRTAFGLEEDYEQQPLPVPGGVPTTEPIEPEMPTDKIYLFRRTWMRDEEGNVLSEEVFKAFEYHLGDPRNTVHIF